MRLSLQGLLNLFQAPRVEAVHEEIVITKEERMRMRAERRETRERILKRNPNHPIVQRVVDNRAFLLGLDEMHRAAINHHEKREGRVVDVKRLLRFGRDPLEQAVAETSHWSVQTLMERARKIAVESGDMSLVGLACIARDPVSVTALRESVVLYAERGYHPRPSAAPVPKYLWKVDAEVAERAERFVTAFNAALSEELPDPIADNADVYFDSVQEWKVAGRCVEIGTSSGPKPRHYHWAIARQSEEELVVREFWHDELWTTERYREARDEGKLPA
jgi:hypothetical protein